VLERADGHPEEVLCAANLYFLGMQWEDLLRDTAGQWAMLECLMTFAGSDDCKTRDSLWKFIEKGPRGLGKKRWEKVLEAYHEVGMEDDWMEGKIGFPQVSVRYDLETDNDGKYFALREELSRCMAGLEREHMAKMIPPCQESGVSRLAARL
jgi:hypothetical protein